MTRHLSARDLIVHLALTEDVNAPVIVSYGLFGSEYSVVTAAGVIDTPDFRMRFARPLPQLVLADEVYDDPKTDTGWQTRAKNLTRLLDRIKEGPVVVARPTMQRVAHARTAGMRLPMPDSDLHPDIIRAMDVYDKARPLVARLRKAIDLALEDERDVPVSVAFVAGRLEKLFEEENEDGD